MANGREPGLDRRRALLELGGLAAGALGAGLAGRTLLGARDAAASSSGPAAVASGLVRCVLTPEQTEGPFYVENALVRRDIREGRRGVPLELRLTVLDVSTCRPIPGAVVDVWHCDAAGVYSGVQGASGTFLRGIQRTNAKGVATFRTIYPGWYPGRTPHIHVKVALGGDVVHTGQLYFPDRVTDAVYRRPPYSRRPGRTTRNGDDWIYRNGGRRSLLRLTRRGAGYVGAIAMGVLRR
ncbi:MAG: hypothetical protein KatS3mg012_1428 [Gaiellaceae bacterium]|nr:MAG: hypothetical protein KatS3mg012_1428 [Gaiellaceae bacterium]